MTTTTSTATAAAAVAEGDDNDNDENKKKTKKVITKRCNPRYICSLLTALRTVSNTHSHAATRVTSNTPFSQRCGGIAQLLVELNSQSLFYFVVFFFRFVFGFCVCFFFVHLVAVFVCFVCVGLVFICLL